MITTFPFVPRDEDFACFAIWEHGRSKESEIIKDLEYNFEVLGVYRVHWSEEHYNSNIARLYENPETTTPFYRYDRKIGRPPFTFIIVRDNAPAFTYMRTVSGAIEAVNRNFIDRKNEFRTWFEQKYQIHCSCNFNEFSAQSALILGMKTLEDTLQGRNKGSIIELEKDLEGAGGWKSWQELFSILNYSSHYLILRDFENLSSQAPIDGLEILCDSFQSFASIANIQQDLTKPYSGSLRVSEKSCHIDIRFVGDGYYPSSWEKQMLDRRVLGQGVFSTCTEDFFFSLLYHTKLHQKNPSDVELNLLRELAEELKFDWFPSDTITNDQEIGGILSGYMSAKRFYYEQPIDSSIQVNTYVAKYLPKLTDIGVSAGELRKKKWKSATKRLKHKIRSYFRQSR